MIHLQERNSFCIINIFRCGVVFVNGNIGDVAFGERAVYPVYLYYI